MVWGVSAAVPAALESALLAEVRELSGPELVVGARAADAGPLPPRRAPLMAVPDDPGNGAARTALLAERARPSGAEPPGRPGETPRWPRIWRSWLRSTRDSGAWTDAPFGRAR
ncbi:MAG: hypothetical protein ACLPKE_22720 [Streptosporangiaceae bacterium]